MYRYSSRRKFIGASAGMAALAGLGWHPRMARAAQGERKFLFFFAGGAWDTTTVFDPHYNTDYVDMDPLTQPTQLGRLVHTSGQDRPNVNRFFERWGNRSAIVNGLDSHSVGHASGTKLTLTGTSASSYADWPTVLAANGKGEYPLPHLVFSGPSIPGNSGSAVVRAGGGTLMDMINSGINGNIDNPVPTFDPPADAIIDAFVHQRIANFTAQHEISGGEGFRRADSFLSNTDRAMEIEGRQFEAGLGELGNTMVDQALKATEMMRLGLTRTAMIGIPGGWDCHGGVGVNAGQFDNFFTALDVLMEHMSTTPGLSTQWLSDEVTIVALSEFGRTPKLNGNGGKDHWPFTSALVVGSGVNGGRSLGATDDALIGMPIDMKTGLNDPGGKMLGTENLGVALLKLGGLNPDKFLPGVESLDALLSDQS